MIRLISMNIRFLSKKAVFLVCVVAFAACADGEPSVSVTEPSEDDVAGVSSEGSDSDSSEDTSFGLLELEGVEVVASSSVVEHPEVASQVEFSGMLIDSGDGFVICVGGVQLSLPPQCGGFVVLGLENSGWAEEVNGVAFGERTVVVSWPPQGNEVELLSEREIEERVFDDSDSFPLPAICEGLDWQQTVDIEVLSTWADQNSDVAALAYFSRDLGELEDALEQELGQPLTEDDLFNTESELVNQLGIGVLQVVEGEAERARAELVEGGQVACIEEVEFSMDELLAAQDKLSDLEGEVFITGSGAGTVDNRLSVSVAVADRETIKTIAALFEDPSILRINASGIIVE